MWEVVGTRPLKGYTATVDGVTYRGLEVKQVFKAHYRRVTGEGEQLYPGWEEEVWEALQRDHPRQIRKTPQKGPQGVTLSTVMSFAKFVGKRLTDGSLAPYGLVEERASVCRSCPKATKVLGCSICKVVLKSLISPPEKVALPQACSACGCYLPLKAWVPREHLGPASAFPYVENCWMRTEEFNGDDPGGA